MKIPPDHVLIVAFRAGRERGRHRARFYRGQCPYGRARPWLRDAWQAGYDYGWTYDFDGADAA